MENNNGMVPANETQLEVKEKSQGKKKTGLFIGLGAAALAAVLAVTVPLGMFASGRRLYNNREFEEAKERFSALGFLPKFGEMADECDYAMAAEYAADGKYLEASQTYMNILDHKDSYELCQECFYEHAEQMFEEEKYQQAHEAFLAIKDYKDAAQRADDTLFAMAGLLLEEGELREARDVYVALGDYEGAAEGIMECDISLAMRIYEMGEYSDAYSIFADYAEQSEKAELYAALCLFRSANEAGAGIEDIYEIYDLLIGFADDPAAQEALEHPFFYAARFMGACWETEDHVYSIDGDYEGETIYHYVPWDSPDGAIYFLSDEEGCCFMIEEDPWFTITGFDSYDQLHPEKMYLVDRDGNEYTMIKYDEYVTEE